MVRGPANFSEDVAATVGLNLQNPNIIGVGAVGGNLPGKLLGGHRDGCQRAAQLMGRGGGQTAHSR